jgi:hypothetical protein
MRNAGVRGNLDIAGDATLAAIAADLRVIDHRSGWSRTLAIGELILERFFFGNIRDWQAHRRDKEASLRRLALRSDCPLGRSALSESVGVFVACRELPLERMRDQLSPSHVAAVLKLDAPRRIDVLERAMLCRWTVRDVRAEVFAMRKKEGERRGRPRSSVGHQALTFLRKADASLAHAMSLLDGAMQPEQGVTRALDGAFAKVEDDLSSIRVGLEERSVEARVTIGPRISRADRTQPERAAS